MTWWQWLAWIWTVELVAFSYALAQMLLMDHFLTRYAGGSSGDRDLFPTVQSPFDQGKRGPSSFDRPSRSLGDVLGVHYYPELDSDGAAWHDET